MKVYVVFMAMTVSISMAAQNKVYVNNKQVSANTIHQLKKTYGIAIANGSYWYDNICGAWGYSGGKTMGFIPARLPIGGRLQSNASNGRSGVFVNGRQLPFADVSALKRIINVVPGRFWLDHKGNGGYEGMPSTFNLIYLSRKSGSSSFYRNSYTGIGSGSSGGTSYVIGKGWSVITN